MEITKKILNTIREHDMLRAGDGVVVGLSGGPDSCCLLKVLCMLRDELRLGSITAVHINHGLRGEESDGDEESARRFAESLGVDFVSRRYDVEKLAAEQGIGTEEAGRRVRYGLFEEVRRKTGARRIAVAHNMDDQAETVLMRIMRGTGARGLAGIPYVRDDVVIRPLLDVSRTEIEDFCREHGIIPRIDSTNLQPVYSRNRIRLELLPMMERFNPEIRSALVSLAGRAAEDESCLEALAEREFRDRWDGKEKSLRLTDIETEGRTAGGPNAGNADVHAIGSEDTVRSHALSNLPPAISKRLIFRCLRELGLNYNVGAQHVENLLKIVKTAAKPDPSAGEHTAEQTKVRNDRSERIGDPGTPKETDLTQGWVARTAYGKIWFAKKERVKLKKGETRAADINMNREGPGRPFPFRLLEMSGAADLRIGAALVRLTLTEVHQDIDGTGTSKKQISQMSGTVPTYSVKLDYDRVNALGSVAMRTRRSGDRFTPRGMKGSKKIQDLMTDRKIPKYERDRIPLLMSEGRALAVGSEAGALCAVTSDTTRVLLMEVYLQ